MRLRTAFLLVIAALAAACGREPEPPAAAPVKPAQPAAPAAVNLLGLRHGASVVSRTAEFWYEATAAHAMDGEDVTAWISPTGGPEQTFVLALPARARIRRLGMTRYARAPHQLRVESSLDGSAWTPVATLSFEPAIEEAQIRDVAPFEALYLRLHTIAPGETFAEIRELHAHGDELAPPQPAPIEGCWTINGRAARFTRRGAEVRGVIDPTDREKAVHLDGGFDGRAHRFLWRAGAQFGDAIVTVTPDGKAISGVSRHKGAGTQLAGDGWLGTRGPCAATAIDADSVRARVLQVVRRYPLYALRFDAQDRLLAVESAAAVDFIAGLTNVRLIARGHPARLTSLCDALAARGVDATQYELVDGTAADANLIPRFYSPNVEIELK